MKKRYFLLESSGHLFCVAQKHMLVTDPAVVKHEDEVVFKHGLKTYRGKVKSFSDKEKDILSEMKEQQKSKPPRKEESFHEDRPRKAALKQNERMKEQFKKKGKQETTVSKAKDKSSQKGNLKKMQEQAAFAMSKDIKSSSADQDLGNAKVLPVKGQQDTSAKIKSPILDKKAQEAFGDSHEDSVSSADSSAVEECSQLKRLGKTDDVKALRGLDSGESDLGESGEESSMKSEVQISDVIELPINKKTYQLSSGLEETSVQSSKGSPQETLNMKCSVKSPAKSPQAQADGAKHTKSSSEGKLLRKKMHLEGKKKSSRKLSSSDSEDERSTDFLSSSEPKVPQVPQKEGSLKKSKKKTSKKRLSSDSESEPVKKKQKSSKNKNKHKIKKMRRNLQIFDGQNYLYSADSVEMVVKLHDDYSVYVQKKELEEAVKSKTVTQFVRRMVGKIYTEDALVSATPQGFPPRGKGKPNYKTAEVQPRLHPDGIKALLAKAAQLEADNKAWRPKTSEGVLKGVISTIVSLYKTNKDNQPTSSSSESSGSSSDSDSSGDE